MQDIERYLLGGWLFIILAVAVFFVSLAGALIYAHRKTKRLIAQSSLHVHTARRRHSSTLEDLGNLDQLISKAVSVSFDKEMETLGTEARGAIYRGCITGEPSRLPRIGMSDRESLESFGGMSYGKASASYVGASHTDSIGSAFFEGMPEGTWG